MRNCLTLSRYNSLGPNNYYPPPGPPPIQHGSRPVSNGYSNGNNGWTPPTGAPPPSQYQPTASGYRPPNEVQQGYQAPYGPPPVRPPSQAQQYGPQMQGAGGQSRPFFQYSQCEWGRSDSDGSDDSDCASDPILTLLRFAPVLMAKRYREAKGVMCEYEAESTRGPGSFVRSGSTTSTPRPSSAGASTMPTTWKSS
jgi:hypothetical protein